MHLTVTFLEYFTINGGFWNEATVLERRELQTFLTSDASPFQRSAQVQGTATHHMNNNLKLQCEL